MADLSKKHVRMRTGTQLMSKKKKRETIWTIKHVYRGVGDRLVDRFGDSND